MAFDDQDQQVDLDAWERRAFEKQGVPEGLRQAIIGQESGGNVNAVSPTNVRGKYQVTKATAQGFGLNRDDPWEQPVAAAKLLRQGYDNAKRKNPNFSDRQAWLASASSYYGGGDSYDSQGNLSTSSKDQLSNPSRYAEGIAKRWSDFEKGMQPTAGRPSAMAMPQQEAAPLQRPTKPQTRVKTTGQPAKPVGPILPKEQPLPTDQPFLFGAGGGRAAQYTSKISPEVATEADRRGRELTRFQNRSRLGQAAELATSGALRGAEGLLKAATYLQPGPVPVVPYGTSPFTPAAQEQLQRQEAAQDVALPNTAPIVRGVSSATAQAPAFALSAGGGTLPAIGGGALLSAAQEDFTNDPKRAALRTLIGATAPVLGAGLVQRAIQPGTLAGRLTSGAIGGAAGNVIPGAIEQLAYEGQLNPQQLAQQAAIGGITGAALPPPAERRIGRSASPEAMPLPRPMPEAPLTPQEIRAKYTQPRRPIEQGDLFNPPSPIREIQRQSPTQRLQEYPGAELQRNFAPSLEGQPIELPETQPALRTYAPPKPPRIAELPRQLPRQLGQERPLTDIEQEGIPSPRPIERLPRIADLPRVLPERPSGPIETPATRPPTAPTEPQPQAAPSTRPPSRSEQRNIERGQQVLRARDDAANARARAQELERAGDFDSARRATIEQIDALRATRAKVKIDTPGGRRLRADLGRQIEEAQGRVGDLRRQAREASRSRVEIENAPTAELPPSRPSTQQRLAEIERQTPSERLREYSGGELPRPVGRPVEGQPIETVTRETSRMRRPAPTILPERPAPATQPQQKRPNVTTEFQEAMPRPAGARSKTVGEFAESLRGEIPTGELEAYQRLLARNRAENPRPAGVRTRPGEPFGGFSQFNDIVTNNRQAVNRLADMNVNSPEAEPLIREIRDYARKNRFDQGHVENLLSQIKNDQSQRAQGEDIAAAEPNRPTGGLREGDVRLKPPTESRKTTQYERFSEPALRQKIDANNAVIARLQRRPNDPKAQARIEEIQRANQEIQRTIEGRQAPPETQPETGPTIQEIRSQERERIAKLSPEELEKALTDVEAKRNAAVADPNSTEAQLQDLAAQVRAYRGRRAELVKAKQLPPLNVKRPPRGERPKVVEATVRSPLDQDVTQIPDERLPKLIQDAERILNNPEITPERKTKVEDFLNRAREEQGRRRPEAEQARVVQHPDEAINGKPIIAETASGKVVVANPENKSGVSVVKDRSGELKAPRKIAASEIRTKAKNEKVDQRTGLTKSQSEFIADKLQNEVLPQYLETQKQKPITIEVPGDGKFTVQDITQANNLHYRVTGKPLNESLSPTVKRPSRAAPTRGSRVSEDQVLKDAYRAYGTAEKGITALREQVAKQGAEMEPAMRARTERVIVELQKVANQEAQERQAKAEVEQKRIETRTNMVEMRKKSIPERIAAAREYAMESGKDDNELIDTLGEKFALIDRHVKEVVNRARIHPDLAQDLYGKPSKDYQASERLYAKQQNERSAMTVPESTPTFTKDRTLPNGAKEFKAKMGDQELAIRQVSRGGSWDVVDQNGKVIRQRLGKEEAKRAARLELTKERPAAEIGGRKVPALSDEAKSKIDSAVLDAENIDVNKLGFENRLTPTLRGRTKKTQTEVDIDDITLSRDRLNPDRLMRMESDLAQGVKRQKAFNIEVVPDPQNPGKYVIGNDGNHRVAYLKLAGQKGKIPVTMVEAIKKTPAEESILASTQKQQPVTREYFGTRRVAENPVRPEQRRQVLENIRSEFRLGDKDNPSVLFLNHQGTIAIHAIANRIDIPFSATSFAGAPLSLEYTSKIATYLENRADSYGGQIAKQFKELASGLREAAKDAKATGEDYVILADPTAGDEAFLQETLREESFHRWQMKKGLYGSEFIEIANDLYENLKREPVFQQIATQMLEEGYHPNPRVFISEAAAKVASGQHEYYGLESEQAGLDFLAKYFQKAVDLKGPEVLEGGIIGTEGAKETLENVRQRQRRRIGSQPGLAGAESTGGRTVQAPTLGASVRRRVQGGRTTQGQTENAGRISQTQSLRNITAASLRAGAESPAPAAIEPRPAQRTQRKGLGGITAESLRGSGEPPAGSERSRAPENKPSTEAGFWAKASDLRKAGLLTSPKTHATNVLSNLLFQGTEEISRIPAGIADLAISAVTKRRSIAGPSLSAVSRSTYKAATDGIREAKQIMKTGLTSEQAEKLQVSESKFKNPILKGYTDFVFNSLGAEDQVFKTYALNRSLESQAKVQALNDVRAGKISRAEMKSQTEFYRDNPTNDMSAQAIADAEVATFQNDNPLSSAVQAGRKKIGEFGNFALDLFLPFDRTPTNIIARTLEMTPLGFGKNALQLGRAVSQKTFTQEQQRAFSQTFGRATAGSALIFLGYTLAQKGLMTGLPETDPKERAKDLTREPYAAIKAGDRWYQVGKFSPAGSLLAIGATIHRESTQKLKDESSRPFKVAGGLSQVALEQPLLKAGKEIIEDVTAPQTLPVKAGRIAGSFVPSIVSDVGGLTDKYQRQGKTFLSAAGTRIPGIRNTLPVKKNSAGQPIKTEWTDVIDPFGSRPVTQSATELERAIMERGVTMSEPKRKPGEPERLYEERKQRASDWFAQYGERLVNSAEYQSASPDDQQKALERLKQGISAQENLIRPRLDNLEPGRIFRSIRMGERTRERRRSRYIYSGEED